MSRCPNGLVVHALQGGPESFPQYLVHLLDRRQRQSLLNPVLVHREDLAQRLFDGDRPIAELLGTQHLGQVGVSIFELSVQVSDGLHVGLGQVAALGSDGLAHLLPLGRCVDQLDLALAFGGFGVVEHPDVGRDARVVEEVVGQADDGVHEIVFQKMTTHFRRPFSGSAREQG